MPSRSRLQTSRPRRSIVQTLNIIKVKLACVILIYCTCLVFAYQFFKDVETYFQFHPFQPKPIEYKLDWYLVWVSDTSRAFWYMVVIFLIYDTGFTEVRPTIGKFNMKVSIIHFYMLYELVLHLDFLLTFRQSPARLIIGFFYIIIVTWYYLTYYNSKKP